MQTLDFRIINTTITPMPLGLYRHAVIGRKDKRYVLYGTQDMSEIWIEAADILGTKIILYRIEDENEWQEVCEFATMAGLTTIHKGKEFNFGN